MKAHQKAFIDTAIDSDALCFGEFELKSGRKSPYFFNAGRLYRGSALAVLGKCYAQAIVDSGLVFDVIFGPAYKGIPLAALTAAALFEFHGMDVPFAYNRKEKKEHGEGGQLVGAPLRNKKVLIIDDVITAGTAIREVMQMLAEENALPAGVVVGLDRQEKGKGDFSAIQELQRDHQLPVIAIIKLDEIVSWLELAKHNETVQSIKAYRNQYGVSS